MDIDQELNNIIFKYNLDKYYPQFRKRMQAEQLILKWVKKLALMNKKILCIGAVPKDILYFSHFTGYYEDCFEFAQYSESQFEIPDYNSYDRVFLISLRAAESIGIWCKKHGVNYENIYDYLACAGIVFEDECYRLTFDESTEYNSIITAGFPWGQWKEGVQDNIQLLLYVQQKKLETTVNVELKKMYIEKMFFLYIYIKNFVCAEKCIEQLKQMNTCDLIAPISAWKDIQNLLKKISEALRTRKSDDIVLYWLDALGYGTTGNMPYLQTQLDKGISFENAFTVTPYTIPTFTTMFCGMKEVTDKGYQLKKISAKNSNVIQYLDEMGYEFKAISGTMVKLDSVLRTNTYHDLYTPSSAIFWDTLKCLLINDKKKFLLAHALIESHFPYLFTNMQEEVLKSPTQRRYLARAELDKQIAFYNEFLGEDVIKIMMSDHGGDSFRERFHVYMSIISKKFVPRKIQELFSLHDFYPLLRQIIEKNAINITAFTRKYLEVQALDIYNPALIEKLFRLKEPLRLAPFFGYCGIITEQHLYIRFNTGKEWMIYRDAILVEPELCDSPNDICNRELLPYFRKLTQGVEIDIYSDEKFKYSRFLYKLYENYLRHQNNKCEILNSFLHSYPEKSIAIRMGGIHTLNLYSMLTKQNKNKIICIVDYNPNCACNTLGYPIVSPDELQQMNIKAVLLSSYDFLDALKEEALTYRKDFDILNIYDLFEKNGIICTGNFYGQEYLADEDYDVGFPFTEVFNSKK